MADVNNKVETDCATAQWRAFIQNSLRIRPDQGKFHQLAQEFNDRSPIPGLKLASILLESQTASSKIVDPRIPIYAEQLIEARIINANDMLAALFQQYSYQKESSNHNGSELVAILLEHLTRGFVTGRNPYTIPETRQSLVVLARWLESVVTAASTSDALMQSLDQQTIPICDSLGLLATAMLENSRVIGVVAKVISKEQREQLSHALTLFIHYWAQASSQNAQHVNRLDDAQKQQSLVEDISKTGSDENALVVAAAVQVETVLDLPLMHTRASLFLFLNSLLVARPMTDNHFMMNYLHNRYKGDVQSLTVDLIVASFDVLAAAMERRETEDQVFVLRSFHTNKVPVLVSTLPASMFAPLTPEFCISQAMNHVDPTVFPPPSYGIMSPSLLQDVRQEFLFSCALHSLLPSENVESLLGESPFTPPPSPERRYTKDNLVQQLVGDSDRLGQLVKQLETLDGNAGAIVAAVTETIRNACASKDTMLLKSACNFILSTKQALDVIMQFTSPTSILLPLCNLLDAWGYEDDQGEYQPVYDEFASVFLLVLAFISRFDLSAFELGLGKDSFVSKFLSEGNHSIPLEQLTEDQSKNLESWTKGLFDPDGITDEVMSTCRPQQFYLLVPTLFSQTVFACSAEVLPIDTLKVGLEYLLEPFLLPSLVGAIRWMTTYAWEQTHNDLDVVLEILKLVTRTPSASGEGQAMHTTIMAMVSQPLARCLRIIRRRLPKRPELESLIKLADSHSKSTRSIFSPCPELPTWLSTTGSLTHAFQNSLQSLITWSANVTVNPIQHAPPYNHRQLLIALQILGAKTVLHILLDEIKSRTTSADGTGAIALDIATSIVCAPTATSTSPIAIDWALTPTPMPQPARGGRLNLRDTLNLEFDKATDLINTDTHLTEAIVRLHRLVEAQLSAVDNVTPMTHLAAAAQIPTMIPGLNITADTSAVDAAVAAAAQQPLDFSVQAATGAMDLASAEDALNMDLTGADGTGIDLLGEGLQAGDEDIFGGLELDESLDFGLD